MLSSREAGLPNDLAYSLSRQPGYRHSWPELLSTLSRWTLIELAHMLCKWTGEEGRCDLRGAAQAASPGHAAADDPAAPGRPARRPCHHDQPLGDRPVA